MAVDFVRIHVPQQAEHVHIGVQLSERLRHAACLYGWRHQHRWPHVQYCCCCSPPTTATTNSDNEPFGRDRMIYCTATIRTNRLYDTFRPAHRCDVVYKYEKGYETTNAWISMWGQHVCTYVQTRDIERETININSSSRAIYVAECWMRRMCTQNNNIMTIHTDSSSHSYSYMVWFTPKNMLVNAQLGGHSNATSTCLSLLCIFNFVWL